MFKAWCILHGLPGDPRAAAPSAPALSELTKSTGKLPEGRTRSSSRQLVDLGLKVLNGELVGTMTGVFLYLKTDNLGSIWGL